MRLINLDDILKQFPKADFDGDDLENMKAYPHWKTDITGLFNILKSVPIIEPCEDAISREAVDNYIVKLMSGYLYDEERARLEDLTAYIWELPSVIPSRPSGKWKRISPAGIYECTNCNQVIMTSDIDCYKYCHGCGVRMEGEE